MIDNLSQAEIDVLRERREHVTREGWTPEHDDDHDDDDLAQAAVCYAMPPRLRQLHKDEIPVLWPWDSRLWKKSSRRRMLVKAASLIIAEIEKGDRARARRAKGRAS